MSTPSGFISGFNYDRGRLTQPPFFGTGDKFYADPSTDIPLDLKFRDGAVMLEIDSSLNKVFLATGGCLVDNKSGTPGVYFSGGFLTFGDHTRFAPEVVPLGGGKDSLVISTGGWDIHTVVTPTNFRPQSSTDYKFPTFIGGESSQTPARDIQVGLHGSQAKIYVEDDSTHSIVYSDAIGNIDLEDTIYVGAFAGPSGTSPEGNGSFGIRVNNGSYSVDTHAAAGDRHLIQNLGGGSFFASIPRFTGIMSEAILISGLLTDEEREMLMKQQEHEQRMMMEQQMRQQQQMHEQRLMAERQHQEQQELMEKKKKEQELKDSPVEKLKEILFQAKDAILVMVLVIMFNLEPISEIIKFKSVPFFYNIETDKVEITGIILKSFIIACIFFLLQYFSK